jgi:hypothetical protein
VRAAWRTDLLERDDHTVPVEDDGSVGFAIDPFEIVTMRLELG